MRATYYYIVSALLLIIYGTQVCPYLDTLSLTTLSVVISIWLLFFLIIRHSCYRIFVLNHSDLFKRQFIYDMSFFILAGIALTIFNMFFFNFPIGSGAKLFFGCVTMGFFASSDLSMSLEYDLVQSVEEKNIHKLTNKFLSLTIKFAIVAIVLSIVASGVLILVIYHDLQWIKDVPASEIKEASHGVIIEIVFVIGVLLVLTSKLVFSYTRNLRFYFERQTEVLKEVEQGKLDGHIPVTTNDEFGIIANYTNHMIEGLKNRTEELSKTQDVTIISLASLAETRDNDTGTHIIRTQHYVKALANNLKDHPKFKKDLDEKSIDLIYKSAPLHDIGKVGIPDDILLKPGKLTDEEFEIMKNHPAYGRDSLKKAEDMLGENSFLRFAQEIAYSHHEKWDGTGYPEGLKGESIPVSGRLMAISDVYDALISKRVYKKAFNHEKARDIIVEGKGKHFDPDIVECFLKIERVFIKIAENNKDI
ncbi:MAG: HD domain-containing protein [Desulfobacterales bacterium]|nr:HD domain-containing protein [Desulfobacterales bacterium]